MHADDTTILITAKSFYKLNVIANNVLNDYVMWFSINLLALNQKKSQFIVFSHHCVTNNILPNLHSNGCIITRVNQIKFLGIIIDENLCWKFHLSSVRDKISKGIAMLKLSSYFMPQDCLLHIYNAFILSYFYYYIIIWGNSHKKYLNPLIVNSTKICHSINL